MAKNKKKQNNNLYAPNRPASQASGPGSGGTRPGQAERTDRAEASIAAMNAEHGAPPAADFAERPGKTLEVTLQRLEELLQKANDHYHQAREKAKEATAERERVAKEIRAQEDELQTKKAETEAEIAAMKETADADLKEKVRQIGETEHAMLARVADQEREATARIAEVEDKLRTQTAANEKRAAELAKRETKCQAEEESLVRKRADLEARQTEAERGFIAERTQILQPINAELDRLRDERNRVYEEIADLRTKAEEEFRTKAAARSKKWIEEDARRTETENDARRHFEAHMLKKRTHELEGLRAMLASERAKAEAAFQEEIARRSALLDERESVLETRETGLRDEQRAHRAAAADLSADQELFNDDRAALERKVERLVLERTEGLRHELDSVQKQLEDARAARDRYFAEIESRRELDRRFGGRTPEEILDTLTHAECQRDEAVRQLRERPDAHAGDRLAALERDRSAWLEEQANLKADLAKAQGELGTRRVAAIELDTLLRQKEALDTQNQLLNGALDELQAQVNDLTKQENRRNPMTALTSLDEREEFQAEIRTIAPVTAKMTTLKEFAEDLRHRIATGVEGRTLYYSERDLRSFLGGLAMSRLLLLQGISGTGKTSLPLAFAAAVGGDVEVVEVQAGWRDRQDLIGYYNAFHRHYYATNFLQALYRAGTPAYRDRLFLMVLDEINLSRPEQFFADFLSALEQPERDRRITLVNDPVNPAPSLMVDGRHLPIPPNVWFVGTANHDESTAEFADKTYDRAHVMEMPRKTLAAQFDIQDRHVRNLVSYKNLMSEFDKAVQKQNKAVTTATRWLGNAEFTAELQKRFRLGWGNRLENQLGTYLPVIVEAGGSIGEAMDHLLVTKLLRKLKDRHDVRVSALESLRGQLQEDWKKLDKDNPPERSLDLLEREIAAKKDEE